MKEPTTFEEKVLYNKTRLPSFTLCPDPYNDPITNKSIESFEDIKKGGEGNYFLFFFFFFEKQCVNSFFLLGNSFFLYSFKN